MRWHPGRVSEDTLTEYVFSGFYYVEEALRTFLSEVVRANRHVVGPNGLFLEGDIRIIPWPAWEVPKDLQRVFARMDRPAKADKRRKGSVVPDMMIEGRDWRLVVEAELSHEFEAQQLVQHFILAQYVYPDPDRPHTYQLLVNRSLSRSSALTKAIRNVCAIPDLRKAPGQPVKEREISERLLWFNWQGIHECLKSVLERSRSNTAEHRILEDRTELLASKGLSAPQSPVESVATVLRNRDVVERLSGMLAGGWNFDLGYLERVIQQRPEIHNLLEILQKGWDLDTTWFLKKAPAFRRTKELLPRASL